MMKLPHSIIAVEPSIKTGAFCIHTPNNNCWEFHPMPQRERSIADLVRSFAIKEPERNLAVVLEEVRTVKPKYDDTIMKRIGEKPFVNARNAHFIRGLFMGIGCVDFHFAQPLEWVESLGHQMQIKPDSVKYPKIPDRFRGVKKEQVQEMADNGCEKAQALILAWLDYGKRRGQRSRAVLEWIKKERSERQKRALEIIGDGITSNSYNVVRKNGNLLSNKAYLDSVGLIQWYLRKKRIER